FQNDSGLVRGGDNLWNASSNSGTASFGVSGTGSRGSISAGYLEQSNVDITSQLTNLIITQRGYQANTKIVSTVDEMMQDVLNLKR
ncbi:flagellar hook-basal body complex protein, partial [Pseudomonas sp. FW306-02-F02-AB]|uniref:flagellar hook-basal body complex protein n=1 Tax=Pseudomonas sp. FW306-02-F02-AB TaxID=2070653 RepID=UPI000CAC736E